MILYFTGVLICLELEDLAEEGRGQLSTFASYHYSLTLDNYTAFQDWLDNTSSNEFRRAADEMGLDLGGGWGPLH
jgi:hypothetical protein